MKLWIDTEYNGYRGDLISLALVAENGEEWYEVRILSSMHRPRILPTTWVRENVIPVLNKLPQPDCDIIAHLARWLRQFDSCHIIADWPEDIAHFCNFIVTGPGERINTPPLSFEIKFDLAGTSAIPHNALEDARALKRSDHNAKEPHR
jgi:hypothetical protein